MQQHAVAEGRTDTQLAQDKHRGLWQAQIDKVRSEEQKLGSKLVKQQLEKEEITNILTDNIRTKDGLKEIIKHLLKTKIEEANVVKHKKSALDQLVQNTKGLSLADDQESSFSQLFGSQRREESNQRPVSFLDKLSAIYSPTTETSVPIEVYSDEEEQEENEYEYDNKDLGSFESVNDRLIEFLREDETNVDEDDDRGLETLLDPEFFIESDRSYSADTSKEIIQGGNRPEIKIEEEDFYTTEEDIAKNFLDDEINSAKSETEELVMEMEKMLEILEAEAASDTKLVEKTLTIIKSKLGSSSLKDLLGDTDFKNSVFYRFAIMRLPLREEDIPVAELAEVKKVVRSNIIAAAEETRELLRELKKDISQENNENEEARAQRLDEARRQLKKLLEIISPTV